MSLSHSNLQNYYQENFMMLYHHNISLSDIENMIPWERYIYITLLINKLNEEAEELENING